jgi:hypothetical protein
MSADMSASPKSGSSTIYVQLKVWKSLVRKTDVIDYQTGQLYYWSIAGKILLGGLMIV